MNTKFVIDSKSPRTDEINALCEKVLKYEIRIQFFETKIAELSQQFKIPQKLRTPQHLSQTDFNTLHILGLSIQQVQALPSVGLTSFAATAERDRHRHHMA